VTNIEFKSPEYHSGDQKAGANGYNQNTPWTASVANGAITWSGVPFATDQTANALRWSTMFNFRFDANQPPQTANASLGLFRPATATSTATSVLMTSRGPSAPPPPSNPSDLDNNQLVNGSDLAILLSNWANSGTGDIDGNGVVGGEDIAALLSAWTG